MHRQVFHIPGLADVHLHLVPLPTDTKLEGKAGATDILPVAPSGLCVADES